MAFDPARLDSLEQTIERLAQELAEARRGLAEVRSSASEQARPNLGADPDAELRARLRVPPPRAAPVVAPQTEPQRPPNVPRESAATEGGLEKFIGQYGALALAVLTIIMGAGALVSWAITHGLLGPWVRVGLGALLAVVLACTGWWLRSRGSRAYGNALLALAVAVVHVVAWGAGPRLALVPSWVALNVADLASIALAALAIAENEELLFAVGLGGALIAPFVMATGVPHYDLLAAYGLIVLAMAIKTIQGRTWWTAVAMVVVSTMVYTAAVSRYSGGAAWVNREFGAGFAAAVTVIALLWERRPVRPWIALAAVTTMSFAIHRADAHANIGLPALLAAPDLPLLSLAGTALFFIVAHGIDETRKSSGWLVAVVVVPAIFLQGALSPFNSIIGLVPGSIVLAWALAYSASSLAESGERRGSLITLGGLAGLLALMLLLDSSPAAIPPVLAAYAVLLATVSKSEKQLVVFVATAASLALAFGVAAVHLTEHAGYTPSPFLSMAALGAASAVGAAYLSAQFGLPDTVFFNDEVVGRERAGALAAAVLGFVWGYLELRRAFSADISTFLLIAYLATWGVVTIYVGRARNEGRLRQLGLGLSVLAALYAIVAASDVQQIGLRVGSYLLVGAFLLGVAWWYRGEQSPAAQG